MAIVHRWEGMRFHVPPTVRGDAVHWRASMAQSPAVGAVLRVLREVAPA